MAKLGEDVLEWSVERLTQWLREEGMSDCVKAFTVKQIKGRHLVTLSDAEIKSLHISHESKKKLVKTIEKYRSKRKGLMKRMFQDSNDGPQPTIHPTRKPVSFSQDDDEDDADEDEGWDSEEWDSDPADDESSSDDIGEYIEPEHDESTKAPQINDLSSVPTGLVAQLRAGIAHSLNRGVTSPKHGPFKTTQAADQDEDEDAIYDLPPDEEELYEEPSDSSGGGVVVRPPSSSKVIRTSESEPAGEYIEARIRKRSEEEETQEMYEQPFEGEDISSSSPGTRQFIPTKVEQLPNRGPPSGRMAKQPSEDMYEVPVPEVDYEVPDITEQSAPPPARPPKHAGPGPSLMVNGRTPPRGELTLSQQPVGNRLFLPSKQGQTSPGTHPFPGRGKPVPAPNQQTRSLVTTRVPPEGASPPTSSRPGLRLRGPSPGARLSPAHRSPSPDPAPAVPPTSQGLTPAKRVPQPSPNRAPQQGAKPSPSNKGPAFPNKGPLPAEPSPGGRSSARVPDVPQEEGRLPFRQPPMGGKALPTMVSGTGRGPAKHPRVADDTPEQPPYVRRPPVETPEPSTQVTEASSDPAPPPRPPKGHPPPQNQPQLLPHSQTQPPKQSSLPANNTPPPKQTQPQPKSASLPKQNQQQPKTTPLLPKHNQTQTPLPKQPQPSPTQRPPLKQIPLPKQTQPQLPLPTKPQPTPPKHAQPPPKQAPPPPAKRGPLPTPNQGHTPPPTQPPPKNLSLPRTDNTPKHSLPPRKASADKKGVPLPAPPTSSGHGGSLEQSSASSVESGSADEPLIPLQHIHVSHNKRSLPPTPAAAKSPVDIMKEAPWFQGPIDRKKAESSLKACKKDGAFLIRNSTRNPQDYSMSLLYKSDVRHLRLPMKDGQYVLGDSGLQKFDSVVELVNYYRQNALDLKAGGRTKLTIPCPVYS